MARRGQGEGSIFRRSDGRWTGQITLEGGLRKTFYGKTRQEVATKLSAALRQIDQGLPLVAERQTVEQFLASWLETRRAELVVESWRRYEQCARLHITPHVGKIKLARLTAQHVQHVYAACLAEGLSTTTTRHVHAVLHRALESAVRLGLVARNVADMVDAPRKRRVEIHPLTREEARQLLRVAAGDRLEALYTLALATGMRQGELLALRWRDLDLLDGEHGRLSVVATLKRREGRAVWAQTKTKQSRRQISLAPPVVEALRQHRHRQRIERVAAGVAWQEWEGLGLVFVDEIGMPLTDWHIRNRLWRLLREAAAPRVRFHDLRHTCATLLLSQGINPKIVSEMLGHSSVAITLDIYSHVLPDMQHDAATALAVALGWS
jgi:integrase